MPIRPENKNRYPSNWTDIALAVKEAAGWRCACTGQCGRGTHPGRCPNHHGQRAYDTGVVVVLTTAHLDHQPENCDLSNLVAMCAGCHLHYDRAHHMVTAALTRASELAAAGQLVIEPVAQLAVATEPVLPPALPHLPAVSYDQPLPLDFDIQLAEGETPSEDHTRTQSAPGPGPE
ncbi:hypothetical protein [Streptomyces lutosisoli]|uniref:HNH endonuclease n=1 Tax=Streptomyces lutosisoli TaxID=2665721 RepID=A0ABW2VY30_9ACTN